MKQPVKAALYMRLSRDDDYYGDSVSIETQRTMLNQYVQEQGLPVVGEYVDDGWTGTNFDRPDFKRMMDDIDSGKVNCVITKDMSRFGRERILMGYYLEMCFPEKGVRYVAITDNEDTEKGLSDFAAIKMVFNEFYAKDTSRKVKAALNAKFKNGERIFAYAPIGYLRDPNQKNKLVVDAETRWIVEDIFDMAVHGMGAAKITKKLIAAQVPTPAWWNFQRDGTFAHIFEGQPESKRYAWTIAQVKHILRDETYIGNSVHYQQTNISFKNKKRIRKPEEEWQRVEGTQDPIVSADVFAQVQGQIATRRRQQKDATTQIFSGLVKCADCGWSMRFGTNKQNKTPYSHYTCSQYGQVGIHCSAHYIRYDVLYPYVLSRLQYWSQQAQQDETQLLQRLQKAGDKEHAAATKKAAEALRKAEKRQKELDTLFARLYEDRVTEKITERNFAMLSEKYQVEQAELETKISDLKGQLAKDKEDSSNAEKWVALIKQYTDLTELTAPLLNTLIEKIIVHEAVKAEDGIREQEVEIYYRFVGKIEG